MKIIFAIAVFVLATQAYAAEPDWYALEHQCVKQVEQSYGCPTNCTMGHWQEMFRCTVTAAYGDQASSLPLTECIDKVEHDPTVNRCPTCGDPIMEAINCLASN